jgi:hypothetical protein
MRKLLLSILASVAPLGGLLLGATATPAGAVEAPVVVDVSSATSAKPMQGTASVVSPPGAFAFYTATFTNNSVVPVTGTFTNTTSAGTIYSATAVGCTPARSGRTVSCTTSVPANGTVTFSIAVQTPTSPTTITNTSNASVGDAFVDLITSNDTSSVSTAVQASNTGSAGFVPTGKSLTYKKHVLTVDQADLGVIAYLSDTQNAGTYNCGTTACAQGLHLEFDQDAAFFGRMHVDVNFGVDDPCRGLGSGSGCYSIYVKKLTNPTPVPVPACNTGRTNGPCLDRTYKTGAEFHSVVYLDTNDPDLLIPVKNLASSTSG